MFLIFSQVWYENLDIFLVVLSNIILVVAWLVRKGFFYPVIALFINSLAYNSDLLSNFQFAVLIILHLIFIVYSFGKKWLF